MNIDLQDADETFINGEVSRGCYTNATEVIRDALRRLREAKEVKRERLVRALQLGEADIEAGRIEQYTPVLLAEIKAAARQQAAEGTEPSADVLPS